MTTHNTRDHRPDAKSDVAIEPPTASTTQPGLGVPHATSEPDLESRIKVRRAELIAKLGELKADKRLAATEARDKLKARLSELAHIGKWGIADGWASLADAVKHRLEHWLAETERQC